MTQQTVDEWISGLDFEFWSRGLHKVEAGPFLEAWAKGEAVLLDVRTRVELDYVDLPFATHMPVEELPARWQELPRDRLVATFCSGGERSSVAYGYLHAKGMDNVRILKGGYAELMAELLPGKLRKLAQLRG